MAVKFSVFALTAGLAAALASTAQGAVQPRTTAPPPVVTIKITITDMAVRMSPKRAQRGSFARFILVNVGTRPHAFALGHLKRGTGSQTGFIKSLKPDEQSILLLFLDYRGSVPYRCTLPADRSRAQMKGIFTII